MQAVPKDHIREGVHYMFFTYRHEGRGIHEIYFINQPSRTPHPVDMSIRKLKQLVPYDQNGEPVGDAQFQFSCMAETLERNIMRIRQDHSRNWRGEWQGTPNNSVETPDSDRD